MAPLQRAAVGTARTVARPGSELGDVDAQGVPVPSRYQCPRVDNPVPTGHRAKGPRVVSSQKTGTSASTVYSSCCSCTQRQALGNAISTIIRITAAC